MTLSFTIKSMSKLARVAIGVVSAGALLYLAHCSAEEKAKEKEAKKELRESKDWRKLIDTASILNKNLSVEQRAFAKTIMYKYKNRVYSATTLKAIEAAIEEFDFVYENLTTGDADTIQANYIYYEKLVKNAAKREKEATERNHQESLARIKAAATERASKTLAEALDITRVVDGKININI